MIPEARIEHMGSSAVPGLWSKGDLDIYIGVEQQAFPSAIKALRRLGFVQRKTKHRDPTLLHFAFKGYKLDVGAQLVANGSEASESFLMFRNLLLRHERLRDEYNKLKCVCTGLSHSKYRRIKGCFIEGVSAVAEPLNQRAKRR